MNFTHLKSLEKIELNEFIYINILTIENGNIILNNSHLFKKQMISKYLIYREKQIDSINNSSNDRDFYEFKSIEKKR